MAVGYRFQHEYVGGDIALTLAALLPDKASSSMLMGTGVHFNPLFFPFPSSKTQAYLGLSLGAHVIGGFDNKKTDYFPLATAGVLTGVEFTSKKHKHFIEIKLEKSLPIRPGNDLIDELNIISPPFPSLSYGISF